MMLMCWMPDVVSNKRLSDLSGGTGYVMSNKDGVKDDLS